VVLRGGVDHGLIIEDVLESLVDLRPAGILGQVASGASTQRIENRPVVGVGGEDHDLGSGLTFAQKAGSFDAWSAPAAS